MATIEPAPEFALEEFLLYLSEQGFPCGAGERVKAMRLYAAVVPQREARLKTILCPVFARGEADQDRFYRAWDLFWAAKAPVDAPPVREGETPLSIPDSTPLRAAIPPKWRRSARLAIGAALILGLAIYFDVPAQLRNILSRPQVISPPPTPPPPDTADETYRRVEDRRQVAFDRACRGMECVTRGQRPWLLLAPLLLVGLIERGLGTRWWRRHRNRRREGVRLPPFEWPVIRYSPLLPAYRGVLMRAAEAMRMRLASDVDELDVGRTIAATIRRAGFPDFRFRFRKRTPEYLFLIERGSAEDHIAAWWHEIAQALQRLGVTVQVYFYSGDIRSCSQPGSPAVVSTPNLLDSQERHHVVVFGRGRDLLQGYSHFPSWMDVSLVRRDLRTLMTPSASFEWGPAEVKVRSTMPVMPARAANLARLAGAATGTASIQVEDFEIGALPPSYLSETEEEARGADPALSLMLDADVFQWLCACALYPRLEWRLTLHLGLVIDPSGEIFEEQKLFQLFRIPWFREGRMPAKWRSWLVKCIDPAKATAARTAILDAIEHNPAPENSYARDQQRLQSAAQRYWLVPRNAHRRVELEAAIEALPAVDVAEDPLLVALRKEPGPQDATARAELAGARFRQSGWRFAAGYFALAGLATAALFITPVEDHRIDVVTRYEAVNVPPKTVPAAERENVIALSGESSIRQAVAPYLGRIGKVLQTGNECLIAGGGIYVMSREDFGTAQRVREQLKALGLPDFEPVNSSGRTPGAISVCLPRGAKLPRLGERALRLGTVGPDVLELQNALTRIGLAGRLASGIFDEATRQAVILFQGKQGLAADGIANPATIAGLVRPEAPVVAGGDKAPQLPLTIQIVSGNNQTGEMRGRARPLRVRVTDAAKSPAQGVTVTWVDPNPFDFMRDTYDHRSTTDADGYATYTPTFGTPGAPLVITASIPSNEKVTFTLTALTSFAGYVLDSNARPLAGATVSVQAPGRAQTATTDAKGAFSIPGWQVAGATAEVVVTAAGFPTWRGRLAIASNIEIKMGPPPNSAPNQVTAQDIADRIRALPPLMFPQGSDVPYYASSEVANVGSVRTAASVAAGIRVLLGEFTGELVVEGHCSEADGYNTNRDLCGRRSTRVADDLIKQGIPANRLLLTNYGTTAPTCKEATPQCYAQNQRVQFSISPSAKAK